MARINSFINFFHTPVCCTSSVDRIAPFNYAVGKLSDIYRNMYSGGPISWATGAKQTVGAEISPHVNRQEGIGVKFALSTIYFMRREGADAEFHPLYQLAANSLGYTVGPLVGFLSKLIEGMVVCVYLRRWAAVIFLTVSAISFWACWYNVWVRDFGFAVDLLALIQK